MSPSTSNLSPAALAEPSTQFIERRLASLLNSSSNSSNNNCYNSLPNSKKMDINEFILLRRSLCVRLLLNVKQQQQHKQQQHASNTKPSHSHSHSIVNPEVERGEIARERGRETSDSLISHFLSPLLQLGSRLFETTSLASFLN